MKEEFHDFNNKHISEKIKLYFYFEQNTEQVHESDSFL